MSDTKQKLLNTGSIFNHHGSPWKVLLFIQKDDLEGYLVIPQGGPNKQQVHFFERHNHSIRQAELGRVNDAGDGG